jgi:hypothetical protein
MGIIKGGPDGTVYLVAAMMERGLLRSQGVLEALEGKKGDRRE